jgi:HD-like signal output (HDOD) protein
MGKNWLRLLRSNNTPFNANSPDMSNESALEELRRTLVAGQLPAMPHSALSVLKLENDVTKVNIDDLARPIEADPGLAAQVLKFLNSSAFGFQSTISNIRQGVALVGIRIVKNFVLWKAVFSLIPKSKTGSFDVGMLWQDSLRRAMFARFLLLEYKKGDAEMAFAGALLQDMAIPLLLKVKAADYSPMLDSLTKDKAKRLSELETEFFDWNHADASLIVGQHWKLPEMLVDLTSNHLKAEEAVANFNQHPERAVVALSALLPSVAHEEWEDRALFTTSFETCFPGRSQLFATLFDRVDREFSEYDSLLQIASPKQSLFVHIDG